MRAMLQSALLPCALAAAALPSAPSHAQTPANVDTSEWQCTQCPFEDTGKVESEFEAGTVHVSDDAARFGRYSGLDKKGAYLVLSGSGSQRTQDGWRWNVDARDLGIDSRALSLRGGKPGLDLTLAYEQQPHFLFDTTRSPFSLDAAGVLALPAGYQRAGNTQLMGTLNGSLADVALSRERRTVSAGLRARLGDAWSTYGRYRQLKRDGTWRQAAGFGFNALELPRPIDDVTDSLELGANYSGARLSAQIGYEGSFYSNKRTALAFRNPYLGPALGQLATERDNASNQLAANLNYRFSDRTALSATVAYGQLRQDDSLLPYTIAAVPVSGPLPRTSLDGNVDTTHLSLALITGLDGVAEFLRTARIKLDLRYDERDNNTPQSAWAYVITDQFTSTPATNQPYGFKQLRATASGDYDLRQLLRFVPDRQRLRLAGGWRHDEVTRSLQEATDSTEDTGWGRVSWQPAGWLDLAVKWGGANREIDRYRPVASITAPQNPLLRKYNMADRERQFAEGSLSLRPFESLSVVATGQYANDDYVNSRLGLRASRSRSSTIGATWAAAPDTSLFVDYAWERTDARQNGSAAFGSADWFADSKDRFSTASAGFRISGIGKALDLDVRGWLANSKGDTQLRTPAIDLLPTLRTRSNGAEIGLAWRRNSPLTVRAALRYEHLDSDDYALDGVLPATVPTLLSLGPQAYDYDLKIVQVSFRYQFGQDTPDDAADSTAK